MYYRHDLGYLTLPSDSPSLIQQDLPLQFWKKLFQLLQDYLGKCVSNVSCGVVLLHPQSLPSQLPFSPIPICRRVLVTPLLQLLLRLPPFVVSRSQRKALRLLHRPLKLPRLHRSRTHLPQAHRSRPTPRFRQWLLHRLARSLFRHQRIPQRSKRLPPSSRLLKLPKSPTSLTPRRRSQVRHKQKGLNLSFTSPLRNWRRRQLHGEPNPSRLYSNRLTQRHPPLPLGPQQAGPFPCQRRLASQSQVRPRSRLTRPRSLREPTRISCNSSPLVLSCNLPLRDL